MTRDEAESVGRGGGWHPGVAGTGTVRSRKNEHRWVVQLGFSSADGRADEAVVREGFCGHKSPLSRWYTPTPFAGGLLTARVL